MEAARAQTPPGPGPGGGPTTVVFGAGRTGRKLVSALRRRGHRVVAFADNDPALRDGRRVLGLPVLAPETLAEAGPDVVAVGSERFHEILVQLRELGVAESRILVPQRDLGLDLTAAPRSTYGDLAFHLAIDLAVVTTVVGLIAAWFGGSW